MWYNRQRPLDVKAPTRAQMLTLRLMIFMGLGGMGFFLWGIFQEEHISYAPLYYILMVSMVFLCLNIAYEWYHYFHISIPEQPVLKEKFDVDILTTFCPGEPYDMIIETLEAIQKIKYPHTTYLCDEANDPYLIRECKRLGVRHVTRDNRVDAKAGNINNALKQATGDICLILDPDHVPAPDFLDHVLPHFQDPRIGFVQVVQAYKNIHENIIAKGSAQQTFQFYGPMMMTMGSYGTAQAIGANCTFRRAALESIGGHAPGLAEDMNTSMKLHAKGWNSVYVPKVLTRGLVPSSLSAYYKQQLKWSRGVFELLVTTYVQNFRKFTLRQKLHYGLLPWHYFSGVIYLINFLIPIISLLFGVMPMKINLIYFLLLAMFLFASTLIIRHYVQRWVMEEDERGFHLLGGLLLIGTWWIHLLGFVFTILRRKVPYNPTPKDGKEEDIISLNIPNILLGAISIFAIIYGLYRDYNPYNLVMAGFAGLNTLFIIFMLWASYQNRFRQLRKRHDIADKIALAIWYVKRPFWIFRHKVYGMLRIMAFPILLLVIGGLYYYARHKDITQIEPPVKPALKNSRFIGIFAPSDYSGKADLASTDRWSKKTGIAPGIISTYMAWEPLESYSFPFAFLDSIYQQGAYPMITWEPWLDQFEKGKDPELSHMERITAGHLDPYLSAMAENFKKLGKPLFLRFAHEPDNPDYPWYSDKPTAGEEFKKAWRYVHRFMMDQGVDNLIWVYNPWKPSQASTYFPGPEYVDWIGVTALNYASAVNAENWNSFEEIYAPYHRTLTIQQNLPVMLAEFGTHSGKGDEEAWFREALSKLEQDYPEIKACVLFASKFDRNLPPGSPYEVLNWSEQADGFSVFQDFQENIVPPQNISKPALQNLETVNENLRKFYHGIEGVNYVKGQDWESSLFPLFKNVVLKDFDDIRKLKLKWIKRYGPGVYDRNILYGARAKDLNVIYALWIEKGIDYLRDEKELKLLKNTILSAVREHRTEPSIKAWHIGNPVWNNLSNYFNKPQLTYQRDGYLNWLSDLVAEIKEIDPSRPISIELDQDPYLMTVANRVKALVPELDAIGINLDSDTASAIAFMQKLEKMPVAIFINKLPPLETKAYDQLNAGWLLQSWQDDVFENYVSFNGLLDHKGRKKPGYQHLQLRAGDSIPVTLPEIRILRPAKLTTSGVKLPYHALLNYGQQWNLAAFDPHGLEYTWQLVKNDRFGNDLAIRDEGKGVTLELTIPPNPHLYQLRLSVSKDGFSTSTEIPLNTPVYAGPQLEEFSREEIDYLFKESKKN